VKGWGRQSEGGAEGRKGESKVRRKEGRGGGRG